MSRRTDTRGARRCPWAPSVHLLPHGHVGVRGLDGVNLRAELIAPARALAVRVDSASDLVAGADLRERRRVSEGRHAASAAAGAPAGRCACVTCALTEVGAAVGALVGTSLGSEVGKPVGTDEGAAVVGAKLGVAVVGVDVGKPVGSDEGALVVGALLGVDVANSGMPEQLVATSAGQTGTLLLL
jgi:hypothetical protein